MAQRRMFSKEITNSSDFQMMSPSAQALYFHIGMNADDDGFCEVFTIVRMTESKPDDLRALHERGLIYLVDSKVGIVKDWHTNNDIRSDRYTKSKYLADSKYSDIYKTIMQDKLQNLVRYKGLVCGTTIGITNGSTSGTTQIRSGQDRIENPVAEATGVPFSFRDEMEKLRVSPRKDLKIVALYYKNKKIVFKNKKQYQVDLKRQLAASKSLEGYSGEEIARTIDYCEKKYPEWTLETVGKRIPEVVNKK